MLSPGLWDSLAKETAKRGRVGQHTAVTLSEPCMSAERTVTSACELELST